MNSDREAITVPVRTAKQFAVCSRCKRRLTNPDSVMSGMGPICRGAIRRGGMSAGARKEPWRDELTDGHLNIPIANGFILQRTDAGVWTNVPHHVVSHSPTGFEWGYAGSGPADLALNIVECTLRLENHKQVGRKRKGFDGRGEYFRASWRLHQRFKRAFIETMPRDGGLIPYMDVVRWIQEKLASTEE
jgi:hypothetical protein